MKGLQTTIPGLIVCLLCTVAVCHGEPDSPADVVALFSKGYGGAGMDETARLTTQRFRDQRPKSVWVVDTWKALREIGYERISGSVLDSEANDTTAAVVMDVTIETAAGKTRQREVYYLIKQNGLWLIDGLQVTDEDVAVIKEKMAL